MKKNLMTLATFALFAACAAMAQLPEKIACAGSYGGHLQGVATDGTNIYWSFTVAVVFGGTVTSSVTFLPSRFHALTISP